MSVFFNHNYHKCYAQEAFKSTANIFLATYTLLLCSKRHALSKVIMETIENKASAEQPLNIALGVD